MTRHEISKRHRWPAPERKVPVFSTEPRLLHYLVCDFYDNSFYKARAAMHPRLTLDNNEACVEQIQALQKCHEDNSYISKLLGACNDPKHALSACFKAQKKVPSRAAACNQSPHDRLSSLLHHTHAHVIAAQGQGQPGQGARQPREG